MSKVWYCLISLLLANFIVEAWQDVPNYMDVVTTSWSQMWALIIYHLIWEEQ